VDIVGKLITGIALFCGFWMLLIFVIGCIAGTIEEWKKDNWPNALEVFIGFLFFGWLLVYGIKRQL